MGLGLWSARVQAEADTPRFLLVFLRGAYDAANLLVPIGSDFYYEARPTIAIARPSSDANAALPLTADWGLHPALRASLLPLWEAGQLAFMPFAGTHDLSRSHFETQDTLELGQDDVPQRNYASGFMNRLYAVLQSGAAPSATGAMAFSAQLPIVFQGPLQVPNMAVQSVSKPGVDARQSDIIRAMYGQHALGASVREGFEVRDEVSKELQLEMGQASRNAASSSGFEAEARRMAWLMKEKYTLGFVDVGGWDTHVGQGGAKGYLANRFEELGRGLATFAQAMGSAWRSTTVVVISEFGRTFRQNGSNGTDHGHGTVYWLLGGGLRGGRILGAQTPVTAATLFQSRDYPVLNEYRQVLGGLFMRQYGLNARQIDQVFPGVKTQPVAWL